MENTEMKRGLKNRHLQMIALGGAIGTGLFYGSASTIALAGPARLPIAPYAHLRTWLERVQAQDAYPSKTIRFVVPYPPGGPTDLMARLLSVELQSKLGVTPDGQIGPQTIKKLQELVGAGIDGDG